MHKKLYFFVVLFIAFCLHVSGQRLITTIAGDGTNALSPDGVQAINSSIGFVRGINRGPNGNIYFCEDSQNKIRYISPSGTLGTLAGNGTAGYSGDNGPAINASLDDPTSVITDASGNVYFIDQGRALIRNVRSLPARQ